MKHYRHDKIVKDYDKQKSKHLESLATRLIKQKQLEEILKTKIINPNFLNLF